MNIQKLYVDDILVNLPWSIEVKGHQGLANLTVYYRENKGRVWRYYDQVDFVITNAPDGKTELRVNTKNYPMYALLSDIEFTET